MEASLGEAYTRAFVEHRGSMDGNNGYSTLGAEVEHTRDIKDEVFRIMYKYV